MVSTLSTLSMAISMLIAIGLPIGLFLFWRKKYGLKLIPLLVGAGIFIVFALVLERVLHLVVLKPSADGSIALTQNAPLLFVLYAVLAAGVFEETGRLIAFIFLKRRYRGVGTGLSYGIGHGGIEAILLVGLTMLSNIVLSFMINAGSTAILGDSPQVTDAIESLISTDPSLFLVGGLERVAAMAVQIAFSVLVWLAVSNRKLWLYPFAIFLHALVDLPAVLAQVGILKSTLFVEAAVFVLAAVIVIATVHIYRKQASRKQSTGDFINEQQT
jgi:uncharacterized membrane protein YhfC